jgi:hypothetical protein
VSQFVLFCFFFFFGGFLSLFSLDRNWRI